MQVKSIRHIVEGHEVQVVNYLKATRKDVGLIINFAEKRVKVKRKVRDVNELLE